MVARTPGREIFGSPGLGRGHHDGRDHRDRGGDWSELMGSRLWKFLIKMFKSY